MAYIHGTDREPVLLFPPSLDEYILPENPARFIDAFVDSLDLADLGFTRATPARTGRPGYDPALLLHLVATAVRAVCPMARFKNTGSCTGSNDTIKKHYGTIYVQRDLNQGRGLQCMRQQFHVVGGAAV